MRCLDNPPKLNQAFFVDDVWVHGQHTGVLVKHEQCTKVIEVSNDHQEAIVFCPECGNEVIYNTKCDW